MALKTKRRTRKVPRKELVLRLRLPLYMPIARLAQEGRRPTTTQITMLLEEALAGRAISFDEGERNAS